MSLVGVERLAAEGLVEIADLDGDRLRADPLRQEFGAIGEIGVANADDAAGGRGEIVLEAIDPIAVGAAGHLELGAAKADVAAPYRVRRAGEAAVRMDAAADLEVEALVLALDIETVLEADEDRWRNSRGRRRFGRNRDASSPHGARGLGVELGLEPFQLRFQRFDLTGRIGQSEAGRAQRRRRESRYGDAVAPSTNPPSPNMSALPIAEPASKHGRLARGSRDAIGRSKTRMAAPKGPPAQSSG